MFVFESTKERDSLWLGLYLAGLLSFFLYYLFQLKNPYIYPDSFLYIIWGQNQWFFKLTEQYHGISLAIDYQTLIKPFAFIFATEMNWIGTTAAYVVNLLLLAGSAVFLYASKKTKKAPEIFPYLLAATFILNAALIYWAGRIGTEVPTIFILSGYFYFAFRYKPVALGLLLLLCLFRPEFVLFAPLLLLLADRRPLFILLGSLMVQVWPFIIAIMVGHVSEYLTTILLPAVVFFVIALILKTYNEEKDKYLATGISLLILAGILVYTGQYLYKLYIDSSFSIFFYAVPTAIMLMLPLVFLLIIALIHIIKTKASLTQLLYLSGIICLYVIYSQKAIDNFRYFLYTVPFISFFILDVSEQLKLHNMVKSSFVILSIVFMVLMTYVLPLDILRSNYWVDRFANNSRYAGVTYSTTPIISAYFGKESANLCDGGFLNATEATIFVDNYSKAACPEVISKIDTLTHKSVFTTYKTDDLVELGRYTSKGQETTIYIISPDNK